MKDIYFSEVNNSNRWEVYLPYVWGVLRASGEQNSEIKESYNWISPFYYPESSGDIASRVKNPSVFGFSCYVWNWSLHLELSKKIKELFPNCLIVFGGPQVPKNDDSFFKQYPWVDILVHGEGENVFCDVLLEGLKEQKNWSQIKGISWQQNGIRVDNFPRERDRALGLRSSPYLLNYFDPIIRDLNLRKIRWCATIEATRGCPYGCSYCDWGSATLAKVFSFSTEKVFAEIEYLSLKGAHTIAPTDANFGLFVRDVEIASFVAEQKRKNGHPRYFYPQMAKGWTEHTYAIAEILKNSDLTFGITLSLQSWNEATLTSVKRKNLKREDYKKIRVYASNSSIPIYTELIMGLPYETYDSFIRGLVEVVIDGVDELRVYPLAVLPNAELAKSEIRKKFDIHTKFVEIQSLSHKGTGVKEWIEIVESTQSMSQAEMVTAWVFVFSIQTFYMNHWLRYVSIYLQREHGLGFREFYETIINNVESYSVLKKIINSFEVLAQKSHTFGQNYELHGENFYLYAFGYASWIIENEKTLFYSQIQSLVQKVFNICLTQDLVNYQSDIMVSYKYDSSLGTVFYYEFDWVSYFESNKKLMQNPIQVTYADKCFGLSSMSFKPGSITEWLRSVVGISYRFKTMIHNSNTRTVRLDRFLFKKRWWP